MWIWWLMFACNLLTPAVMIGAGWMMEKHCPKEINAVYGYRTARSMKNMDTWRFAHEHCGRLWQKWGTVMLMPTVLLQIPFYSGTEAAVSTAGLAILAVQVIVLILSVFPTEAALKRNFSADVAKL